ncbi:hypothetical protein OH76DRAFT_247822 [Lentinus brumalis]|uniref:mRNA 3'-end-processing protein RNA14 n=1 Tax=Lentinus brumalis TaxID=2498619 RepID=A0A371CLS2_9APHY|nr:hypothetical protein OH76DRAFT_247822 [Polyporus brumalis]
MTESSPSDPMLQDPPESAKPDGDQNHLTENILNALRQLQQSGSPVPPTPTQQSSQETQVSLTKQETTPQPQSEWERLRAQLREKPVDADSWLKLVDLAEESGDIEKIKDTYEGMLEIYPNTPSVQIAYLQHFLDDPTQYNYAETLFKKFLLRTTPSVELLKFYLTYIRCDHAATYARLASRHTHDRMNAGESLKVRTLGRSFKSATTLLSVTRVRTRTAMTSGRTTSIS